MTVAEVLADPDHACHIWVDMVQSRGVRVDSGGSASLWSRRTTYGTGLLATAAHVLSPCSALLGEVDGDCPEMLVDPKNSRAAALIRLAQPGGGPPISQLTAHFELYNPFVPEGQFWSPLGPSRYDLTIYAVDNQTFQVWDTDAVPEPIHDEALQLHDPYGVTTAEETWGSAEPGMKVLLLGFPTNENYVPAELAVSVGLVLDDDAAHNAILMLAAAGDEEGLIPYDAEAEFLFEGHASNGMSGGGVYDKDGRQLGIAVRTSFLETGPQYVRAVRMSYVTAKIQAKLENLSPSEQAAIVPYLEQPPATTNVVQ